MNIPISFFITLSFKFSIDWFIGHNAVIRIKKPYQPAETGVQRAGSAFAIVWWGKTKCGERRIEAGESCVLWRYPFFTRRTTCGGTKVAPGKDTVELVVVRCYHAMIVAIIVRIAIIEAKYAVG